MSFFTLRKIIILLLFISAMVVEAFSLGGAFGANSNTPSTNNQPPYTVIAGTFNNENSALALKQKLSTKLNQPITIDHETNPESYIVKIGPIENPTVAKNIEQLFGKQIQLPSKPEPASPPTQALSAEPIADTAVTAPTTDTAVTASTAETSETEAYQPPLPSSA